MDTLIAILKSEAKTNRSLDLNNDYLYHGIYVTDLENLNSVLSIIDNGLLTSKKQYEKGLISIEEVKLRCGHIPEKKSLFKFFKSKKAIEDEILNNKRSNIVFFSPNENLFNRVYDISFVVRKDSNYEFRDTNIYTEEQASSMKSETDLSEYTRGSSVPNNEIVAIKMNLDALLDENTLQQRSGTLEVIVPRLISFINSIYDELEKNGLDIPIINSNDRRILNKEVFRKLRYTYENIIGGQNERL